MTSEFLLQHQARFDAQQAEFSEDAAVLTRESTSS